MGNCLQCFGVGGDDEKQERLLSDDAMGPREFTNPLLADKSRSDARAFVVVKHVKYGYLLLEANKAKKGRHFQLPGGHVDVGEMTSYGEKEACRVAAARELLEETGLDLRSSMHRLVPVDMQGLGDRGLKLQKSGRHYFKLDINDSDAVEDIPTDGHGHTPRGLRLATPLSMEDFRLCLSHEHTGYKFEHSVKNAAEALRKHSGGCSSEAIMLIEGNVDE